MGRKKYSGDDNQRELVLSQVTSINCKMKIKLAFKRVPPTWVPVSALSTFLFVNQTRWHSPKAADI